MQCPPNAPPWLQMAWRELGQHEVGDNRGAAVQRFIELSHCGELGDPWCAIFANAMLEEAGVKGTRSPSSQSFRHSDNFTEIDAPALGCIVVYWRGSRSSGLGHVGFYVGERGGFIYTLGGNESDMVQAEFMAKAAGSFGLVGYFWPHSVAMPKLGALSVPADAPAHLVAPGPAPAPASIPAPAAVAAPSVLTVDVEDVIARLALHLRVNAHLIAKMIDGAPTPAAGENPKVT